MSVRQSLRNSLCLQSVVWLSVLVGVAAAGLSVQADESIQWRSEVNEAWRDVNPQRPLLLYVTLDGCAYCVKMERDVYSDPGIAADIGGRFVAAKIDRRAAPDLVARLGVRIYPTTVIISHDAQVLDSIGGYLEPEEFRTRLARITAVAKAPKEESKR